MPRTVVPLNDTKIRQVKAGASRKRLSDGDGLYLLALPNGAKLWRFDYIHEGRRNTLSFGAFPEVPLALARQRRADARAKVAAGIDPSRERQEARQAPSRRARSAKWPRNGLSASVGCWRRSRSRRPSGCSRRW